MNIQETIEEGRLAFKFDGLRRLLLINAMFNEGGSIMDLRLVADDKILSIDFVDTCLMSDRRGQINRLHAHPVFHLIYIIKGSGTFWVGEQTTEAQAGMLYIISPNEPHQFITSEQYPLSNLESTFLLLEEDPQPCTLSFFNLIERSQQIQLPDAMIRSPISVPYLLQPMLMEGFQKVIDAQKQRYSSKHIEVALLDLIFRTMEIVVNLSSGHDTSAENAIDITIAKLKQFLYTNFHRPVHLQELAQHVYLSPNYVCRIFKQRTGQTPMQYLLQLKLEEARKLLLYTEYPVYYVAEQLGFDKPSYFARTFRHQFGLAPTDFRNAMRIKKG